MKGLPYWFCAALILVLYVAVLVIREGRMASFKRQLRFWLTSVRCSESEPPRATPTRTAIKPWLCSARLCAAVP